MRQITYLIALVLLTSSARLLANDNVSETLIGIPISEHGWSAETKVGLEKDLAISSAVMKIAPERKDSHIWLRR